MNILKKIDDFIVNLNLKTFLLILLSQVICLISLFIIRKYDIHFFDFAILLFSFFAYQIIFNEIFKDFFE